METVESPSPPFIETVRTEIEADGANVAQQPDSELLPFIETVRTEVDSPRDEVEAVRAENQRLHIELGNSASEKELLKQELVELRAQLETKRALREEITNLAPIAIGVESPDAATILSQLRAKRKKSTAMLGDVEKILEILGASPEN
jgi:predicted RNase H-like nuclease (RuvC/YqgF family)